MKAFSKIVVGLGALAAVASASANVVVDLFDDPSPGVQTIKDATSLDGWRWAAQNPLAVNPASPTIFGGYRDLGVQKTNAFLDGTSGTSLTVGGGFLSFSNDSLVSGRGIVRWDGSVATPDFAAGMSSINLAGPANSLSNNPFGDFFQLDIIKADAGFTVTWEIFTNANTWSRVVFASNAHATPTSSLLPLLAWLDCANVIPGATTTCGSSGPVDFSNVVAMQVLIDSGSTVDLDLTLNQVNVVPEPGMLALVGLGLVGVAGAARRRKAQ